MLRNLLLTGLLLLVATAPARGAERNLDLPAAGVGARFVLSAKHRVALSTDIAVGNDGAEFYFGVGEAI